MIIDLVGKGTQARTVPMPSWAKTALDRWAEAAALTDGRIFRRMHQGGYVNGDRMSAQAIADVVTHYSAVCGYHHLAAHDLRRTFAKLAHKGGAGLNQIQLSLGHASIKTTERYLRVEQDLAEALCDVLG